MVKINIIYLAVVSVIAINSLALAQEEDFLTEGISGRIRAIQIEKALKNPDHIFIENGRTYKILNDRIPEGLLREMADNGESISGKVQQSLAPNGIAWQFHYDVPGTYNRNDEALWSLHPSFVGSTIDFQVEDITPLPHTSSWYEFWK